MSWLSQFFPDAGRDLSPADIALHRIVQLWQASTRLRQIFGSRIEAMSRPNWGDTRQVPRLSACAYQDAFEPLATIERDVVTVYAVAMLPRLGALALAPGEPSIASVLHEIGKPLRTNRQLEIEVIRGGVATTVQLSRRVTLQPAVLVPESVYATEVAEAWVQPVSLEMNVNQDDQLVWNFSQGVTP